LASTLRRRQELPRMRPRKVQSAREKTMRGRRGESVTQRHRDGNGRHRDGGTKTFRHSFHIRADRSGITEESRTEGQRVKSMGRGRERERERGESESRILEGIRVDDISPPRREYLQSRVKEERAHLRADNRSLGTCASERARDYVKQRKRNRAMRFAVHRARARAQSARHFRLVNRVRETVSRIAESRFEIRGGNGATRKTLPPRPKTIDSASASAEKRQTWLRAAESNRERSEES